MQYTNTSAIALAGALIAGMTTSVTAGGFDESQGESKLVAPAGYFDGPDVHIDESYGGELDPKVKVAVLDSGISLRHREFRRYSRSKGGGGRYIGGFKTFSDACQSLSSLRCSGGNYFRDENGHGTSVASIIAGKYVGNSSNAELMISDVTNRRDGQVTLEALMYGLLQSQGAGAKVANVSFGVDLVGMSAPSRYNYRTGSFPDSYSDMAIVQSAGNNGANYTQKHNTQTNWKTNDPMIDQVLIVGALNRYDRMARYTNYPGGDGRVQDRFIMAPGTNVAARPNGRGNGYTYFRGTSSAAPVVSAGMATMMAKWDFLDADQAAQILLDTADTSFTNAYQYNSCGGSNCGEYYFGQGKLDMEAALTPSGIPQIATAGTADAPDGEPLSESYGTMTGPASTAVASISSSLSDVSVFDSYGRDFQVDMSDSLIGGSSFSGGFNLLSARVKGMGTNLVRSESPSGDLAMEYQESVSSETPYTSVSHNADSFQISAYQAGSAMDRPGDRIDGVSMLSYAGTSPLGFDVVDTMGMDAEVPITDKMSLTSTHEMGTKEQFVGDSNVGHTRIGMAYGIADNWEATAGISQLSDSNGIMGLTGSGALGTDDGGQAMIPTVGLSYQGDGFSGFANYQRGTARADFSNSLIESVDATVEKAAIGGEFSGNKGIHSLAGVVSTPLHMSGGTATVRVPTGREISGEINYDSASVGIDPDQRPVALEIGYAYRPSHTASLSMNLMHTDEASGSNSGAVIAGQMKF